MNQGGMDCTSHYGGYHMSGRGMRRLTVFVGEQSPREVDLGQFHKEYISFGRSPDNDLVLPSPNVSKHHGTVFLQYFFRTSLMEKTGDGKGRRAFDRKRAAVRRSLKSRQRI